MALTENPKNIDFLADTLSDNLKSRDASASKNHPVFYVIFHLHAGKAEILMKRSNIVRKQARRC